MAIPDRTDVHPAWLPAEAFRAVGSRRVLVLGEGLLVDTVREEVTWACARYGGGVRHRCRARRRPNRSTWCSRSPRRRHRPSWRRSAGEFRRASGQDAIGEEGFVLACRDGVTVVLADEPAGLLYGLFHVVRLGEAAFAADRPAEHHRPTMRRRMLDHWDNVDVHPVMGQVERGYAGGSIFWQDGALRGDLSRVRAYGRLLAACGVNAVAVNNVNVHATEAQLLTDRLGDVAAIADELRPYGIRVHLSVNFASPVILGGLPTADPLDERVREWWARDHRAGLPDDPRLRRLCGQSRLGGAARSVHVRARPRRRREHARRRAGAVRRGRPLARLRLQPPAGLAGPVDRPGPRGLRPLRPAGRAVPGQRRSCR